MVALRDLERTANLVALAHVFDPARHAYPDDDVLARWALVLEAEDTETWVLDDPALTEAGGLAALVALDHGSLRHLAVHPDRWGSGLGAMLVGLALDRIRTLGGNVIPHLWCLVENHRARALYERLGWQVSDDERRAPWPPYPREIRYTHAVD